MTYSYEEIRAAALDILADRERPRYPPNQYNHLSLGVAAVLAKRGGIPDQPAGREPRLSAAAEELFMDVFWDLVRQGIIILGHDRNNNGFPWCRVSHFGRRMLENQDTYFFHDVSMYETLIKKATR